MEMLMKERPILFNAPMVRALLAGTKTQTRRVVKPRRDRVMGCELAPNELAGEVNGGEFLNAPWQPGDRLWVRETFYCDDAFYPNGVGVDSMWREIDGQRVPIPIEEQRADMLEAMYYRADGEPEFEGAEGRTPWRPSIHMPRWASRITLEVTGVCVERLQDISEADAYAEGIEQTDFIEEAEHQEPATGAPPGRYAYRALWESINGPDSWTANPWVWAIEFNRISPA